jgi:hypothetical protein
VVNDVGCQSILRYLLCHDEVKSSAVFNMISVLHQLRRHSKQLGFKVMASKQHSANVWTGLEHGEYWCVCVFVN